MNLDDIRESLSKRTIQHALLAGLIVCLAVVFYMYFMKDLLRERDALKVEIANLETSVAKMTAVESQLKEFEQELAQLKRYLADLRSILSNSYPSRRINGPTRRRSSSAAAGAGPSSSMTAWPPTHKAKGFSGRSSRNRKQRSRNTPRSWCS